MRYKKHEWDPGEHLPGALLICFSTSMVSTRCIFPNNTLDILPIFLFQDEFGYYLETAKNYSALIHY